MKVTTHYVQRFCDAGMSREFFEAVWALYKADGTDLREISSLAEQRVIMQTLRNKRTIDVPGKIDDAEE